MFAVKNGNEEIITKLINSGANLNIKSANQKTALHLAAKTGKEKIVGTLLDKGAFINEFDINGKTPLALATENGYKNTASFLKTNGGLDLNKKYKDVYTYHRPYYPPNNLNLTFNDGLSVIDRQTRFNTTYKPPVSSTYEPLSPLLNKYEPPVLPDYKFDLFLK